MKLARRFVSAVLFGLAGAFLLLALMVWLTEPAHGQTVKPAPKDEEPTTQSVAYPDLCDVVEEGSWTWYLLLCGFTK